MTQNPNKPAPTISGADTSGEGRAIRDAIAAFAPTIDDAATDALRGLPREGTLARVYTDAQQRAIDRLEVRLAEAFDRIAALESERERNGMGYRG
jgi:flagellar motility protein MotE (MotC chaperone)